MKPLVSIITPSYNQGKFIRQTIESVLGQDYPNIEYIVVDGGSTDDTRQILEEYSDWINWISENDQGQSDAINKGFHMAKGEILGWINSDDCYESGAVSAAVALFEKKPDAAMVYGKGYIIDVAGNKTKPFKYTVPFDLWSLINIWDYIMQPATFFRADAIKSVGYLNRKLQWTMDWDLWIRLALNYEVIYTNCFLACSREYAETKTSTGGIARLDEIKSLQQQYTRQSEPYGYLIYYYTEMSYQNGENIPVRDEYHRKSLELLSNSPVPDPSGFCGETTYFALRLNAKNNYLLICLTRDEKVRLDIYINARTLQVVYLDQKGEYAILLALPKKYKWYFHNVRVEAHSRRLATIEERSDSFLKMRLTTLDEAAKCKLITTPARRLSWWNRRKELCRKPLGEQLGLVPLPLDRELVLNPGEEEGSSEVIYLSWHSPEQTGRWSGKCSKIIYYARKSDKFSLKITYFSMQNAGDTELLLNGTVIGRLENGEEQTKELLLQPSFSSPVKEKQILEFVTEKAVSPSALGISDDNRVLGIYVMKIIFCKI